MNGTSVPQFYVQPRIYQDLPSSNVLVFVEDGKKAGCVSVYECLLCYCDRLFMPKDTKYANTKDEISCSLLEVTK